MKTLRILHLVFWFIVLFPAIVIIEIVGLFVCIRAAHTVGKSAKAGLKAWLQYLKTGVLMNKDFVFNGL